MLTTADSQVAFYREFLMGRGNWQTSEFGISVTKEEFIGQAVVLFGNIYADAWSIDELLLHPREDADSATTSGVIMATGTHPTMSYFARS